MKRGTFFHRPSIKLATRFDAEGREIEVEVREDEESTQKQQQIMDTLVANGYYRAYIRVRLISVFVRSIGNYLVLPTYLISLVNQIYFYLPPKTP